jgi:hypothetical protein
MQIHRYRLIGPRIPLRKLFDALSVQQFAQGDGIEIECSDDPPQKFPITHRFTLEAYEPLADAGDLLEIHRTARSGEIPEGPTTVKSSLMDQLPEVVRCHRSSTSIVGAQRIPVGRTPYVDFRPKVFTDGAWNGLVGLVRKPDTSQALLAK